MDALYGSLGQNNLYTNRFGKTIFRLNLTNWKIDQSCSAGRIKANKSSKWSNNHNFQGSMFFFEFKQAKCFTAISSSSINLFSLLLQLTMLLALFFSIELNSDWHWKGCSVEVSLNVVTTTTTTSVAAAATYVMICLRIGNFTVASWQSHEVVDNTSSCLVWSLFTCRWERVHEFALETG